MLTSAARPDLARATAVAAQRDGAAAPEPGSLAEYDARRCVVCGGRYPWFGFGCPLTADGGVVWACGTHRHEVEGKLNGVSRMAPAPSEPAKASVLPGDGDEQLQRSLF